MTRVGPQFSPPSAGSSPWSSTLMRSPACRAPSRLRLPSGEALTAGIARVSARGRRQLTRTLLGAATLLSDSGEDPAQLRINVTSPNGTTQAGLEVVVRARLAEVIDGRGGGHRGLPNSGARNA